MRCDREPPGAALRPTLVSANGIGWQLLAPGVSAHPRCTYRFGWPLWPRDAPLCLLLPLLNLFEPRSVCLALRWALCCLDWLLLLLAVICSSVIAAGAAGREDTCK